MIAEVDAWGRERNPLGIGKVEYGGHGQSVSGVGIGASGMISDGSLGVIPAMPLQPISTSGIMVGGDSMDSGMLTPGRGRRKEDRIPQWGYHETKEFIAIRAELEKDFTQTKRNKTLWEFIAGKMKEKGFRRSADQCKCKWKNLVNRYKGKETSEPDNGRQCPFFEELDAIFKERAKNMDRLLLESGGIMPKKKGKKMKRAGGMLGEKSSDDDSEDEDDSEESEDERVVKKKKRKADKERQRNTADKCRANSMQEVLEDFFQQQQRIEEIWRDCLERREHGRQQREQEWRETIQKLEQDRMMRERIWWEREEQWRERDEQRRQREEARSQKRDELFAALISRVIQDEV